MRLIDANKLMESLNPQESVWVGLVLSELIANTTTVKAIPVEWIEKYANRYIDLENRNYFAYRGFSDTGKAILYMLEEWEKENEELV